MYITFYEIFNCLNWAKHIKIKFPFVLQRCDVVV
jgi:hypothetical protein